MPGLRLVQRTLVLIAVTIAVTAAGCSDSNPNRPGQTDEPQGPNTLTPAERAAGWRLLFDGRTTTGWRGFKQPSMPGGWQVVDGALTRVSGGGDIITIDQFANFELALEWQIGPGGNSGIMYRVTEAGDFTFQTGPEMQVLDNAGHPDGASSLSSAGACYGLYPPTSDATRPVGSWNAVRIIANGTHVEHWVNGVKIVEYEIGSADWTMRWQASPHRDAVLYGRSPSGYIALQDHGDRVAYRSIKIRVM